MKKCNFSVGLSRHLYSVSALVLGLSLEALIALPALAQEVEVTDTRNDRVITGGADSGSPANVTITDTGTIQISDGAAIIVNSNNNVTNSGALMVDADSGAIGIHINTNATDPLTGDEIAGGGGVTITSTIINNSVITITAPNISDTMPGGPNYGILLSGEGKLVGDITFGTSGSVNVAGADSAAVALRSEMVGNLTLKGALNVSGERSTGLLIERKFTGNIVNRAQIVANNVDGTGIFLGGDVSGSFINSGTVAVGTSATLDIFNQRVDGLPGKGAVFVHGNIAGGFLNDRFQEAIDDGDTDPSNDVFVERAGNLTGLSGAYALFIGPDADAPQNITIGAFGVGNEGFGIINRGVIGTDGVNFGLASEAIRIEGSDTFTTLIEGGFFNDTDGDIQARAFDAKATGISFGNGAIVPLFRNDGSIMVNAIESQDDDLQLVTDPGPFGGDAFGLVIEAGATVNEIINNGEFRVISNGVPFSATAILDLSGTVTRLTNTGTLSAIRENNGTGKNVAIDFSASNRDIRIDNSGTIIGDILLGSGNDTVIATGGSIAGLIDFAGGTNILALSGNATFLGAISGSNVNLSLIGQSQIGISAGQVAFVNSANFAPGTGLSIEVDGSAGTAGQLDVAGTANFAQGSSISAQFTSILPTNQSFTIVQAGNLNLAPGASLSINSTSFLVRASLVTSDTGIVLNLVRRSSQELGINAKEALVFDASISALALDPELGGAIANITSSAELSEVIGQLSPVANGATKQLAILGEAASLGAIRRRLQSVRDLSGDALIGRRSPTGAWVQQVGSLFNQKSRGTDVGFDGGTVGLAAGIDKQWLGLDAIGLSIVQTWGEADRKDRKDRSLFVASTRLGTYASLSTGPFFVDGSAGIAFNSYEGKRSFTFGGIQRLAKGNWGATQYGGSAATGFRFKLGNFYLEPQATISYVSLTEKAYEEQEAGDGVNLAVARNKSKSLVATAGAIIGYSYPVGRDNMNFELHGNVVTELKDNAPTLTARFAAGSDSFTITGTPFDKKYFQAGGAIAFHTLGSTFTIDYDVEMKDRYIAHKAGLTLRVRF